MAKSNQTKLWLENYNDSNAFASPDMVGDGFSNVGRNSSPAWGGQFQNGGKTRKRNPTEKEIKEWSDPGFRLNSVTDYFDPVTKKWGQSWFGDMTRNEQAIKNNLQPARLIQGDLNTDPATIQQPVRVPKYYDVIDTNNQTFGGGETFYRSTDLSDLNELPTEGWNRKTIPHYQMGGSVPGTVGFTYARTKGIPSEGPYAKKTLPSAQDGTDIHGTPMYAKENYVEGLERSNYDPRLNRMNLGEDYNTWADKGRLKAHENYHAIQHAEGRDNFDIGHNTENRQWAEMQKRPALMSTDEVWNNFYNRKNIETNIDVNREAQNFPEAQFFPQAAGNIIANKIVDPDQYNNPSSLEGEAQRYEYTGKKFQNGGEMRYYQNGLDFQPKTISKNGAWLSKYEQAQDGDLLSKWRESHPSVRSMRNDSMNRKIEKSKGKSKETNITQKDNTKTVTPKEIKKLSGREQNELAQKQSEEQARKDWVQGSMEEAYKSPLMSPGYFTPEGVAIGALQGAFKMPGHIAEGDYKGVAIDALMALPIGIPAAKTLGRVLGPEKGLLSNAYKLNPLAFKSNPEMGYRMLGKEGFQDALKTGVLRAKPIPSQAPSGGISLTRNTNRNPNTGKMQGALDRPYFADGIIDERYAADYMAAVNKAENNLVPIATHKGIAPSQAGSIPLENATLYKKHWLQKYKEVSKPTSNFNSEINWKNWNKEIPNNSELMKEYNAIEQTSKANGSWMKNPDGSVFQGTPEQFVQQNSKNFKKYVENAKGNYNELLEKPFSYHGSSNNNITEFHTPQHSNYIKATGDTPETGIFLTNEKSLANTYATKNKNGRVYELYAPANYAKPGLRNPNNIIETSVGTNIEKPILTGNLDLKDVEYLKNLDYTGIADHYLPNSSLEKVVFDSNIIKSATGNNGMFDMTNPNIYKSVLPIGLGLGAASQIEQKREGGIIKDDRGQWDHPGEITEIGSNQITMQGVPYPVLGISDTGDTQMMYPEEEYKFDGEKVTEYPMARNGIRQEQKGLQNLEDLTNFTNYNKPTNWLNKYN